MEFRNADTKSEISVHSSPLLVRRAENIMNERKAWERSVRLG